MPEAVQGGLTIIPDRVVIDAAARRIAVHSLARPTLFSFKLDAA
jgi:hypothetical protein